MYSYIAVFIIIMCFFSIASTVGFGSGILALPLLTNVIGVHDSAQLIVFSSLLTALLVISKNYKYVDWRAWLKIILICGTGLPVGIFLMTVVSEAIINIFIAFFVTGVGTRGLYRSFRKNTEFQQISRGRHIFHIVILFIGGIIQGALGVGGPFIVVYAADLIKDKNSFRATMSMVWVLLNCILTTRNFILIFTTDTHIIPYMLLAIPAVIISFIAGNWMHKKISTKSFIKMIYILLIIIGIITFFNAL